MFDELHKYGIEPVVTIFHFDLPLDLQQKYGDWRDRRMGDAYVEYSRVLFERFANDVKYWLTYNEQNMLVFYAALDMMGTGGKPHTTGDLYTEAHNQLVAQARVIKLCHQMCPGAKIGPAPNINTCYPATSAPEDYIAAQKMDDIRNNFYLDALVWGRYPQSVINWLAHQGYQMDIQPGDMEELASCHPDFIGFNCYGNDTVKALRWEDALDLSALATGDNREVSYLAALAQKPGIGEAVGNEHFAVNSVDGNRYDPWCIRVTARRLTDRYHLPLIITENGYGRPDTLEADGAVHDQYRIEHLRETIAQMEQGIEEGADLFGYCPWSAIDLVSTREGITKRYGFVYVDRDEDDEKAATSEMRRYRKDSFSWYRGVIASNGESLD